MHSIPVLEPGPGLNPSHMPGLLLLRTLELPVDLSMFVAPGRPSLPRLRELELLESSTRYTQCSDPAENFATLLGMCPALKLLRLAILPDCPTRMDVLFHRMLHAWTHGLCIILHLSDAYDCCRQRCSKRWTCPGWTWDCTVWENDHALLACDTCGAREHHVGEVEATRRMFGLAQRFWNEPFYPGHPFCAEYGHP